MSQTEDRAGQDSIPIMSTRQVQQVTDGTELFFQAPLTVTASKTGKIYNVLNRIRVQQHEPGRCQCKASKTGCGRADYVAEFYVIVDHYTKITPVVVAQVYAKGSHKDGTKLYLSATAKITTVTVDDSSTDSAVHPPLE
jgi:hypothetical protein